MRRLNPWILGLVLGLAVPAGPAIAAAQELPLEIQVDLYLVRADRQIESQDFAAALESLDIVLLLQANNGLETPVELWFKHAQVALDAGYPETAINSVTRYLQEAGQAGEQYTPALVLLDQARMRAEGAAAPAPSPAAPDPSAPNPAAPAPAPVAQPVGSGSGLTLLFPMVGVNAANIAFGTSGPLTLDASQYTGMAGGVGVSFPIGDGFLGVQLAAQWAQKGARVTAGLNDLTTSADVTFQSIDVTVLARVSPPAAPDLPFYALIGPYVAFETDCRIALGTTAGTGRFTASDDCANANFDTQPFDFGLSGGIGFEMGLGAGRHITIGLLYNHGLQDIDKYIGETARHRVFSAHAGLATAF